LGVLGCKPLVLSREDGHLLLCDPGSGLGFVALLLAKLHPVLPEARGSTLGSIAHRRDIISMRAIRPKHHKSTTAGQPKPS
jgi:hypothetical protein